MFHVLLRIGFWSVAYLAAATLPLAAAWLAQAPPGRGFLLELGVGLGLAGYAMFILQFVSTSRFGWVAPYFGTDAQIQFHRATGITATAFVLAHPLVLFVTDPGYLEYLDPRANLPRAVFLSAATVAVLLAVVLPLWRASLGLSYEWWRITHGGLALIVLLVGLAHALQVGHYVSGVVQQAGWIIGAAIGVLLLAHTRLIKPWRIRKRAWRVVSVEPDVTGVYRITLEAAGHDGMPFRAGQYAWLTIGATPFALQQHPFSFASSDQQPRRLEFGIKETGDFTDTIKRVQPDTHAFLEGPYGRFTLDKSADGAALIVGGIGVTPALSILRSARDRGDRRPMYLIYANNRCEDIAFRGELEQLTNEIDLQVVHVLDSPPPAWRGETGHVTAEILQRHVPLRERQDLQYFVCGPAPMMDAVERALLELKVPLWRIVSERFDLV